MIGTAGDIPSGTMPEAMSEFGGHQADHLPASIEDGPPLLPGLIAAST